ncbi:hypothetical protein Sgou_19260 [Streptomyces gougerotii]|uniref:Uncharacterized protein n=1 Tax=Streptomyces gougerotii TaxID=53448 RepID=A0ABQ1D3Z5_9ACTN|nr:hypothetical protein Sgou_19260 [Streptomyces gougerotii]
MTDTRTPDPGQGGRPRSRPWRRLTTALAACALAATGLAATPAGAAGQAAWPAAPAGVAARPVAARAQAASAVVSRRQGRERGRPPWPGSGVRVSVTGRSPSRAVGVAPAGRPGAVLRGGTGRGTARAPGEARDGSGRGVPRTGGDGQGALLRLWRGAAVRLAAPGRADRAPCRCGGGAGAGCATLEIRRSAV